MTLDTELQKQVFMQTVRNTIHRDGIEELLDWLQQSDFFTAPASTKYHGSYEGGLCEHALDVYHMAQKAAAAFDLHLSQESIAIATLFHDLCKVDFYKAEVRSLKVDGAWIDKVFYTIDEKQIYGGHGSKSVYLVQQFIKLNIDEAAAINCHMGYSDVTPDGVRDVSSAFHAHPLAWLTNMADGASVYLLER